MIKERNLGVAEARIGLSAITCLLVALGYVIVHRLGDATLPAEIEAGRSPQAAQVIGTPGNLSGLPTVANESDTRYGASNPQSTNQQPLYRPQWLSPQNDSPGISLPSLGIDDPAAQQSDRFDPSIDPLGSEIRSGQIPAVNSRR